jgi:signal transduction histidine kinase
VLRLRPHVWPAVTVALIALAAVEIAQGKWDALPPAGLIAFVVLVLGPLPMIRSAPVAAVATMVVSSEVLMLVWGSPRSLAVFFVVWLATFAAAVYGSGAWLSRLTLFVLIASLVVVSEISGDGGWAWSDFLFSVMLAGFSAGLGLVMRGHVQRSAVAQEEAREAHQRARTAAARAAEAERTRIARDLHDVVAHGVSLMVVQAAAAANVLDRDIDQARLAVEAIASTGQRTLGELRRMLDVMRADLPTASQPQPGLAALEALTADTREAGNDVALTLAVDNRCLPAGLDVTAYRIVQEALTNARRHAPGSTVRIDVWIAANDLHLEIVNSTSQPTSATATSGYGIVGMRERATLYGGDVQAGPVSDGWRVHARLPLDPTPTANVATPTAAISEAAL